MVLMVASGVRHFSVACRAKWGTDPEKVDECKQVELDALTDKARLRQQPFEGHKPVPFEGHTPVHTDRRLSAWTAQQI